MDKQKKNDNQGTMKILRFEAGILQTGTESSCAKENGVVLTLNDQSAQGSATPNRSNS
jgi:hypothetical protein